MKYIIFMNITDYKQKVQEFCYLDKCIENPPFFRDFAKIFTKPCYGKTLTKEMTKLLKEANYNHEYKEVVENIRFSVYHNIRDLNTPGLGPNLNQHKISVNLAGYAILVGNAEILRILHNYGYTNLWKNAFINESTKSGTPFVASLEDMFFDMYLSINTDYLFTPKKQIQGSPYFQSCHKYNRKLVSEFIHFFALSGMLMENADKIPVKLVKLTIDICKDFPKNGMAELALKTIKKLPFSEAKHFWVANYYFEQAELFRDNIPKREKKAIEKAVKYAIHLKDKVNRSLFLKRYLYGNNLEDIISNELPPFITEILQAGYSEEKILQILKEFKKSLNKESETSEINSEITKKKNINLETQTSLIEENKKIKAAFFELLQKQKEIELNMKKLQEEISRLKESQNSNKPLNLFQSRKDKTTNNKNMGNIATHTEEQLSYAESTDCKKKKSHI